MLLEIDTTVGSEAVTMTFTGFSGTIDTILPLHGSNFFLVGGSNQVLYRFDRTLAASQSQSSSLGGQILDIVKSRDSGGYLMVTSNTNLTRVVDNTAGLAVVGTISNPNWPDFLVRRVAASSIYINEFATMDENEGDDANRILLSGTTATHH